MMKVARTGMDYRFLLDCDQAMERFKQFGLAAVLTK